MKAITLITLILIIVGGINWLLVGLADFDLVATIFGGSDSVLATIVYVLALYQLASRPFLSAKLRPKVPQDTSDRRE